MFIDFAAILAGIIVQYTLKYSKHNKVAMCNMSEILKPYIKVLLEIFNAVWDKRVKICWYLLYCSQKVYFL